MKKRLLLTILLIFPLMLFAQKYAILDFEAEIQDSTMVVCFNLITKTPIDLGMYFKTDSTSKWRFCKTISGDIEEQTSGHKTIFWNYLKDSVPEDELLNNKLLFRIMEVEPYAYFREFEAKRLLKQKKKEEREIAKEKARAEGRIANENLNGHYIGLGSGLNSSGYYGEQVGVSYEFRYQIFGINVSVGYGGSGKNFWGYLPFVNANAGLKIYLTHKKKVLRNIYFNFLPVCYFGQNEVYTVNYVAGINQNMMRIDSYKYSHLWGVGLFLGYSPVWHLNKKVALGFNIDVGIKTNYRFNKWCSMNWDLGFVIKL